MVVVDAISAVIGIAIVRTSTATTSNSFQRFDNIFRPRWQVKASLARQLEPAVFERDEEAREETTQEQQLVGGGAPTAQDGSLTCKT